MWACWNMALVNNESSTSTPGLLLGQRAPARATDRPISVQADNAVAALSVRVLCAHRCSLDFPTACIGSIQGSSVGGQASANASNMPRMIIVSVPQGRCGPCCSIAAVGSIAMAFSGSMLSNSGARRSAQSKRFIQVFSSESDARSKRGTRAGNYSLSISAFTRARCAVSLFGPLLFMSYKAT